MESYSVNTKNFSKEYGYEYDDNGYITAYGSWQDGKVSTDDRTDYHYDSNGQLIRTDEHRYNNGSQITDGTSVAEYDSRGNLTAVKNYAYSNDDTLTGNQPEENFEVTYSYEDNVWIDGIKYQKGSEEQYVYDENGNPTEMMEFLYDKSGSITGFTYADKTYFYVKNPQGDVTNIVDSNGVNLVNYYYCCYGESTSYVDESAYEYEYDRDSIGILQEVNPITYRGYYRDEETSFYYLQSRYYIPTWGRFVNADIPVYAQSQKDDFAGINLFAYCYNNPVNYTDESGNSATGFFVGTSLFEAGVFIIAFIISYFVVLLFSGNISTNIQFPQPDFSPPNKYPNDKQKKIIKKINNKILKNNKIDLKNLRKKLKKD